MAQRSLKSLRCLFAAISLLAISSASWASTIRDDTSNSSYTALSAQPDYASSGYISINQGTGYWTLGSGTLIAPNWVLTAAHVVTHDVSGSQVAWAPSQITFGQGTSRPTMLAGTYGVSQVVVFSGWNNDLYAGNDVALIQLSGNVTGVTPAPLYNAATLGTELGKTATTVGYQGRTGTGLTGNSTLTYARRASTNVIDLFGSNSTVSSGKNATNDIINYDFGSVSSNLMFTDFDSPNNGTTVNNPNDPSNYYNIMGSGDPTLLEGAQVPGDSGGGLFLTVSGTTYLAGVTSFVGYFDNSTFTHSGIYGYYGDYNGYTRVSPMLDFINSTVPEPTLLMLAVGPCIGLLRRRRQVA